MWIVSYFTGLLAAAGLMAELLPGNDKGSLFGLDMSSMTGPFWLGLPGTICLILLLIYLVVYRRELTKLRMFCCVLLLGWVNCWVFAVSSASPLLNYIGQDIRIRGVVLDQPKSGAERLTCQVVVQQALLPEDTRVDKGSAAGKAGTKGVAWQDVKGRLLVQVRRPQDQLRYGDLIEVEGKLELPSTAANPGQFDYRNYLSHRGVYVALNCPTGTLCKQIGAGQGNVLQGTAFLLRDKLAATGTALFPGPEGQLLNGMVLGAASDLDSDLRQTFNRSGLSHLLSVSGFHVALVAALPMLMGKWWCWPDKAVFGVTTVVVLFYAFISGFSPPVARSAIMILLGLFALLFKQHKDWGRILALAAFLTTFPYPVVSTEPGYQLSFAATWAILALTPLLHNIFRLFPAEIPEHIQALLTVPLAAVLGTWPLVAYHFNQFSLMSIPANILLVDLAGLILILGLLLAVIGLASVTLASFLQPGLGLLLKIFIQAAEFFAGLPGAVLGVTSPAKITIGAYYLLLWLICSNQRREVIRRAWAKFVFHWRGSVTGIFADKTKLSLTVSMLIIISVCAVWLWPGGSSLQVSFLDVGEGDSIFIKTPGGKNMLIDTGRLQLKDTGEISYDAGERVVLPYLRSQGVNRLDLLVLTHPHIDHFGGAAALVEQLEVGTMLVTPAPSSDKLYNRLLTAARNKGTQILQGRSGQEIHLDPQLKLDILSPEGSAAKLESESDLNNQSLVIKLTYGKSSFLFTGDVEQEGLEKLLSSQSSAVSAAILKISHHGSKTGYLPDFYRRVSPLAAVVPVGVNLYGHPHYDVVQYFRHQNIPLLRTDEQGAVTFWSDGKQVVVDSHSQGKTKLKELIQNGYSSSRKQFE